ncbi:alpha-glucosidase [Leptospira ryugenii]|uniref:Alpha-glucosidase n=1 Tax=Leptospira ryugenii TaxID=1917863 RepID=A0A2P2E3W5_9LEPT|nr:alpha-glucosidase [Leptospira ryugenii]GBF51570.1 alpha-glucosidase [Leptospira ryugenii]
MFLTTLRKSLFGLCALYSLSFALVSCASGQIQFAKETISPVQVGNLLVSQSENKLSFVSKGNQKVFFSVSLSKAFLQAGRVDAKAKYRMASFKFVEKPVVFCTEQSLDSLVPEGKSLIIRGKVSGKDCQSDYKITVQSSQADQLDLQIQFSDPSLNRIWLAIESKSSEKFFGFGEQFTHDQMKGKTPFLFTEEQGIGRGDQPITAGANLLAGAGGNEYTTYAPIPHFISSENRSLFVENSGYSRFDLSQADELKIEYWDTNVQNHFRANIWLGKDARELLNSYTKKTGRYTALPDWAYGTWLGVQGGTEKVNFIVDQAKAKGNPITALWIQDWCGRRVTNFGDQLKWRWYADEKLYPDFKNFVKGMNQKNVQVLGYINSFLADTDPKKPGDDFTNPLLAEAKSKGYLVKNQAGEDYLIQTVGFPAYLIDLTNPQAVQWTKSIIKKNMIDVGLSGWMADFGEWLPFDAKLYSGIDAKVYHNIYPVDWARINREAIKEAGKEGKIVFFTRAGYSYSNQYSTLFWEGDQMVSWGKNDGLPSAIIGLTSGGMSGIALNHSDIGGYTTISNPLRNYHRPKELLLRWAELSAFTPVFRTHEGNRPLKNWQVYTYTDKNGVSSLSDEDTVTLFAEIGKIHYALKDYLKDLVSESTKTGLPVVRHNFLVEPNDEQLLEFPYQFFLGDDLLVAPIIKSGKTDIDVYLPEGSWEHIWTGKKFNGKSEVNVEAPIGKPAVFLRVGGKKETLLRKAFQQILTQK